MTTSLFSKLRGGAFCLLILALLACYQQLSSSAPRRFLSFERFEWSELQGCVPGKVSSNLQAGSTALGIDADTAPEGKLGCRSLPFTPASRHLSFWMAGAPHSGIEQNASLRITALGSDGSILAEKDFDPSPLSETAWTEQTLTLAPDSPLTHISLALSLTGTPVKDQRFAIRSRVEYFAEPSPLALSSFSSTLVIVLLALCIVLAQRFVFSDSSRMAYFAFLALLACGIHFRQETYFYWDAWHVLQRYMDMGWQGLIYTHNEHFLPIFFGVFYLESIGFGDAYSAFLAVSLFIHTLNAYLFSALLQRLAPRKDGAQTAARMLGVFWLLSALHSEALHWAFEQSLLLSQFFALSALLFAWDAIRSQKRWPLIFGVLACAAAPLCFGNGFSTAIQLVLVLGLGAVFVESSKKGDDADLEFLKRVRRSFAFLLFSALMLAGVAGLYLMFKEGAGHSVDQAKPFDNLTALWNYLLVGAGLGTVLRGLGLYPTLDPTFAGNAFETAEGIVPGLSLFGNGKQAELAFAHMGAAIALLFLVFYLLLPGRRANLRVCTIGILWMFSVLLLPALGRWQLGVQQSLSLRYHYTALCGLCILLLPAASFAFERRTELAGGIVKSVYRFQQFLVLLILTLSISMQLGLASSFTYFSKQGRTHREFIAQLDDWNTLRARLGQNAPLAWDAKGTPWAGQQPNYPSTLTPGRHPDDITRIRHWLNPEHPDL